MSRAALAHLLAAASLLLLVAVALTEAAPLERLALLRQDAMERAILLHIRAPGLILAALTGAALGLAGTVLQVMLRNPLASPDIIGFGAGSAAGASAAILLSGSMAGAVPGALAGGALAAGLVVALGWRDGISPLALILIGVAISLMLTTATDLMLSVSPAILAGEMARFLTGSFAGADLTAIGVLALATVFGGAVLARLGHSVESLALGDDLAISLGLHPDRIRLAAAGVAALLMAVTVAFAGPLPFVAFLAGPIARAAAGRPGTLLTLSALVGAVLAVGADILSGLAIAGARLPAGVFTALVGGPMMLALLLRLREDRG
ncbi:MAG: iron ABC transporter permease [Pseudomonadota bacterium]